MKCFLLMVGMLPCWLSAACWVCGPTEGEGRATTVRAHRCVSVCFGAVEQEPPAQVRYAGLLLGLVHASLPEDDVMRMLADERCDLSGASVQLLAQTQVGTLRGVALSGLMADLSEVRGVQLSGLASRCREVKGIQAALALNRAEGRVCGLQLGLFNVARELCGVQFGLLNTNAAGWTLPLVNISW